MQRFLCVLMILLLSTAIFAGGQQDEGAETGVETVVWYGYETDYEQEHAQIIAAFEQENPGIKVEVEYLGGGYIDDYLKVMDTMLMSGEDFDILQQQAPSIYTDKAGKGLLAPLDEFIAAEGKTYNDLYTAPAAVDGKIYGLPFDAKIWFVLINKDALEESGLSLPPDDWDWDMYREYAKAMTKGEGANKRYGSFMHTWYHYSGLNMYNAVEGNPWVDANGDPNFSDPLMKEFMQYRYQLEMVDKVQYPYTELLAMQPDYNNLYFSGKVAMLPVGTWMVARIGDEKYNPDFVSALAPLPVGTPDSPAYRTFGETRYMDINARSTRQEASYKFIRYYTTEGMYVKGSAFSAARGSDNDKIFDVVVPQDKRYRYDMPTFLNVFNNKIDNAWTITPNWFNEVVEQMFVREAGAYYTGGRSLEDTLEVVRKQAADIIKNNY